MVVSHYKKIQTCFSKIIFYIDIAIPRDYRRAKKPTGAKNGNPKRHPESLNIITYINYFKQMIYSLNISVTHRSYRALEFLSPQPVF